MYGQTNCWVSPDMRYIAFITAKDEVFISTERAARNMSWQGFTKEEGKIDILAELKGSVSNNNVYSINFKFDQLSTNKQILGYSGCISKITKNFL